MSRFRTPEPQLDRNFSTQENQLQNLPSQSPPKFGLTANPIQKKDETPTEPTQKEIDQRNQGLVSRAPATKNFAQNLIQDDFYESGECIINTPFCKVEMDVPSVAFKIRFINKYENYALAQQMLRVVPREYRSRLAVEVVRHMTERELKDTHLGLLNDLKSFMLQRNWGQEVTEAEKAQYDRLNCVISEWTDEKGQFIEMMKKDRLSTEEIAKAREYIESLSDGWQKEDYFLQLQEKVEYVNQRNVTEYAGEEYFGGSCNLSSLAMAVSYMGASIPAKYKSMEGFPETGIVEQLDFVRRQETTADRTDKAGWEAVSKALGLNTTMYWNKTKGKDWWTENIHANHLAKGHGVMCSINGHITRIQSITDTGIVTDDPYGESTLGAGSARDWDNINDTDRTDMDEPATPWAARRLGHGDVGEDHVWPWANVKTHEFLWIAAFSK